MIFHLLLLCLTLFPESRAIKRQSFGRRAWTQSQHLDASSKTRGSGIFTKCIINLYFIKKNVTENYFLLAFDISYKTKSCYVYALQSIP